MTTPDLPPAARAHELRLGKPLREYLLDDLAGRTLDEIADELGVHKGTLYRWLPRLGLKTRTERRVVIVERPSTKVED